MPKITTTESSLRQAAQLPRTVWVLGVVSLLMDTSSELIHSLLPAFLVSVLHASMFSLGAIEGVAEGIASASKLLSGALSDWMGRRKPLVALGYGLAAASKPLFPLAGSLSWIVAARVTDRIGKWIRGAPRDALLAAATPPQLLGAAFGLRQALDTLGACVGAALAIALMHATGGDFRLTFWLAVIPAWLAVLVVMTGVQEPENQATRFVCRDMSWKLWRRLGKAYWWVAALATVYSCSRFSEAFLILRASSAGLPTAWAPVVLIVMNVAYSLTALPAGSASDRLGRERVLLAGLVVLILADVLVGVRSGWVGVLLGVVLWGVHLGFTQGVFAAMIAETAPSDLRGVAYGVYHLATGVGVLVASLLAGALWQAGGPLWAFLVAAGISCLAAVGTAVYSSLRPALVSGGPAGSHSSQ